MGTRQQEFVTFYSPGTLFAEQTSKAIERRDSALAVALGESIVERYGARPWGFRFETRIVADPVPDGMGGTLRVESRTLDTSGMHYLGGRLETFDDVAARNDASESILRSNMRCNGMWIVVANERTRAQPFDEADVIVDAAGTIVERGDEPRHVAYRVAKTAERDAEWAAERAKR